ncbi:MAG: phosphoesterase, partial [Burkholderiales bacterium PBB4]
AFAPALLQTIEAQVAKLVLLDHHQSAAEQLSGFVCRCGVVHFEMHKSGARLAWEFFHPESPVPDLVRYVEDRDLWNWHYPESAAYLAALDMEPFDFARWAQIAALDGLAQTGFMARGQAMDEKFTKLARDMAEGAQPVVFNGIEGLMLNAPGVFHSLLGNMLSLRSGTFALLWTASATAKGAVVKVGLRSQRGFDCIPLARSMGGGGHAQACGFKMSAERLPGLLAGRLDAPEPQGT